MESEKQIVEIAIENGASIAGIASTHALKSSPSLSVYTKTGDDAHLYNHIFKWLDSTGSLLVMGLSHPEEQPELDWWDGIGTPGNRLMVDIMKRTSQHIEKGLKLRTHILHYYVEKGGVFLKDAAVMAGLGCIGKNNMLVTKVYGPRIRLRAMFMDTELESTGPVEFDPCAGCKEYCRKVCPEKALKKKMSLFISSNNALLPARDGAYKKENCNVRMEKDVSESKKINADEKSPIKYCRKCEFACPVGKE